MARAGSFELDDHDSDSDSWSFSDEPVVKKMRVSEAERKVKRDRAFSKHPRRPPVLLQPVGTWKASPELSDQFDQELDAAMRRHASQQASKLPLNTFCFQILIQSGWKIRGRVFVVDDFESSSRG